MVLDLNVESIDENISILQSTILSAIDEACPLKERKGFQFSLPPEIVELIRQKRKIRKKAQANPAFRPEYNFLQKVIKNKIANYKRSKWENVTGKLNYTQGKEFWDLFKRLTKTGKGGGHRVPQLKNTLGEKIKDPTQVADLFATHLENTHQIQQGPLFSREMETTVNNFTLDNPSLLSVSPYNSLSSDFLFTSDEALEIISKGKNRKAPGLDQIFNIMLKNIPMVVFDRLTDIFNVCISIGYFPKA